MVCITEGALNGQITIQFLNLAAFLLQKGGFSFAENIMQRYNSELKGQSDLHFDRFKTLKVNTRKRC